MASEHEKMSLISQHKNAGGQKWKNLTITSITEDTEREHSHSWQGVYTDIVTVGDSFGIT